MKNKIRPLGISQSFLPAMRQFQWHVLTAIAELGFPILVTGSIYEGSSLFGKAEEWSHMGPTYFQLNNRSCIFMRNHPFCFETVINHGLYIEKSEWDKYTNIVEWSPWPLILIAYISRGLSTDPILCWNFFENVTVIPMELTLAKINFQKKYHSNDDWIVPSKDNCHVEYPDYEYPDMEDTLFREIDPESLYPWEDFEKRVIKEVEGFVVDQEL